jgi:hypothetical protein
MNAMEYKVTGKCFYCSNPTAYLVGVSKASWKKKMVVSGETCQEHVVNALDKIGDAAFGSTYWPSVSNLGGKLLYHSFQADLEKLSFKTGWCKFLLSIS